MASGSNGEKDKDKDSRWYFTAEQLANSPSRKCGIEPDQELMYRQQAANLIQCMGQALHVSQLCINTAIVYMHRFYAFHSFTNFHRNAIAQASLFLAAKVEEQPRKLEHVIKESCKCLQLSEPTKETYTDLAQDLVFNENVLLQTLGFDVAIDHPHTHVVKMCHLVKASKDLGQTSYFMASNSLHLTTMCLQYRPTVVACFCIHLACKWSRWEIPPSIEKKHWFQYIDKSVTMELLQKLTEEFLHIFDRCPSRLKSKMKSMSSSAQGTQRIGDDQQKALTAMTSSTADTGSAQSIHHGHHRHHHSSHHHSSKGAQIHAEHPSNKNVPVIGSSGHKIPHSIPSTSNNINRSRNERAAPNPVSTYVPNINQHPALSNNSNKNIPSNVHPNSNRTLTSSSMQKLSNNPASDGSIYPANATRDLSMKNRNLIGNITTNPVVPQHSHNSKLDQRHMLKDTLSSNNKPEYKQQTSDLSKQMNIKSQESNMYTNSNRQDPVKNSSIGSIKQPTQQLQNSITNQTHSITDRNQFIHGLENPLPKMPSESTFKLIDDTNRMVEPMQMCTPPKHSKTSSIFSPDYKESALQSLPLVQPQISSRNNTNSISSNIKINKDSPTSKKAPYSFDRKPETPKKEKKNDHTRTQLKPNIASMDKQPTSSSINKKLIEQPPANIHFHSGNSHTFMSPYFDPLVNQNNVPPMQNNISKRPFMDVSVNQEDLLENKDIKMRKIDVDIVNELSPTKSNDGNKMGQFNLNNTYDAMFGGEIKNSKPYPNAVNGIETNPVLVSSLLKEICTDSVKFGTPLNPTAIEQPKLPNIVPVSNQPSPKKEQFTSIIAEGFNDVMKKESPISVKLESDETMHGKTVKKKKKDKHKHKEKEKSKDREERKKHKKDKERHKDREKNHEKHLSSEPSSTDQSTFENSRIKITIPKEKINFSNSDINPSMNTTGFKIKIPKDCIKTELTSANATYFSENQSATVAPTNSLKIKISKDMINYNNSSHTNDNAQIHHTGKKRDRDKDREKNSKSSKNDLNKQNFNSNGNNNPGNGGGQSINRSSSSTNQNTEIWVNM